MEQNSSTFQFVVGRLFEEAFKVSRKDRVQLRAVEQNFPTFQFLTVVAGGGLLGLRPDPNLAASSSRSYAVDEAFTWFFARKEKKNKIQEKEKKKKKEEKKKIRIMSMNKDNSHSWVRISHGLNKLVTDLIDKEYDDNEQETSEMQFEEFAVKTNVLAFASRSEAEANPRRRTPAYSSTRTYLSGKELGLISSQKLIRPSLTQCQNN